MTPQSINDFRASLKRMVIRECNIKNLEPSQVSDDEQIIGGTGALVLDSLDAVEIVAAIERNFGLKLENAGAARSVVKNFAAMSDYVLQSAPAERIEDFLKS